MIRTGEVTALGGEGEGVLRDEGKVVFVAGALPGEEISYRKASEDRRFDHGVLLEILRADPDRRPTPCRHDHPGGCGGCSLLHASASLSARLKADALREFLGKAGIPCEKTAPPRTAGSGLGYRNHARFFVTQKGRLAFVARPAPGRAEAREKIAIDGCPVLHPGLDALRAALDGRVVGASEVELRIGAGTGEKLVILDAAELPRALDPARLDAAVALRPRPGSFIPLRGLPRFHEQIDGVRFRVSADSFFQVNTEAAEELVRTVRAMAGPLGPSSLVIDCYAGVGLFTMTSLGAAGRRVAIESSPSSHQDAAFNAGRARGVSVRLGETLESLRDLVDAREKPDVIVLDPPRAGIGLEVVREILRLAPSRVIVVACDPKTLARDLPPLLEAGYRLETLVPIDQFPGTHHLEAVALLVR